jgi:predicted  nucleic acid-binding Zn-ribbon protein
MKPVANPNDRAYVNSKKPLRLMEDILRDEISELKIIIKSRDNKIAELDRRVSELENALLSTNSELSAAIDEINSMIIIDGHWDKETCHINQQLLKANRNDD